MTTTTAIMAMHSDARARTEQFVLCIYKVDVVTHTNK